MKRCLRTITLMVGMGYVLLQAATISGVVTDSATGDKLDGVRVQLRSGNRTVATDTTDAEGAYSFAEVDTGNYSIRASMTGYVTKTVDETISAGEDESTVDIALAAVITTTVAGTVTDSAEGTALAGAVVQLRSGARAVGTDTTDAEGNYSFADVETGSYSVRASLTGYVTKTLDAEVGSEALTVDVPMVAVVTAAVGGTVTDSTEGTALAGAVVQIRSGNRAIATDTSGSDGKYSFDEVESGEYTVRVSLSGYVTKTLDVEVGSEAVTVDVALTGVVTATVEGKVTDTTTGSALGNAVVQLRSGNRVIATDTSDSDGAFSFADVETGTYSLRVSLTGYQTKTVTVSVTASSMETVNVPLAILFTKTVQVIVMKVADSTALEGASVVVAPSSGSLLTGTTDASGEVAFEKLEEGTYTISASAEGFTPRSSRYTLDAESGESLVLYLDEAETATKSLTGTVSDSVSGSALAGVTVSIRIGGGGGGGGSAVTLASETADDGTFTITGIPANVTSVALSGTLAGYRTTARNVTLDTEATTTVSFKMLSNAAGIIERKIAPVSGGRPYVDFSTDGLVTLYNMPGTGLVQLFGLDGRVLYRCSFTTREAAVTLPQQVRCAGTTFILRVSRPDGNEILSRVIRLHR